MKTEIISTEYYFIKIDTSKNRAYFCVLARWQGIENFSNFLEQWEDIIEKLESNFTIVSDLRIMPIFSKDVEKLFAQIQEYLIANGLLHVAEVTAVDDIANLQITRISTRSNLPLNKFVTVEAAEKYLDGLVATLKE